nr:uncharacterized protein LOC109192256 isoform X2 [Ipomoea trifida]
MRPSNENEKLKHIPTEMKELIEKLETELNLCKDKVKPIKCEDTGDDLQEEEDKVDSELENAKRRRQSNSWRPSKHAQPHDNAAKKRLCVRRQSARLKHEQIKAEEDLYPIDDAKDSVHQPSNCDSIQENSSASACTSSDNGENNHASENEARESKRPSLSRPSRQAARKVQSYKEIPLNVKMRRSE